MLKDCRKCPHYSTCTTLCDDAEEYVNQDYVPPIEFHKQIIFKEMTLQVPERIFLLRIKYRLTEYEIADIVGVDQSYVSRVLKKLTKKALKK